MTAIEDKAGDAQARPAPAHRAAEPASVPPAAQAPEPPEPPDDDLFDDDAAWNKPQRVNRLTWVLLGALVAVLAFAGGVQVQKAHDAPLISTASRARQFAGAFGGGSGQGGSGQGGSGRSGQAGAGQGNAGQGGGGQGGAGGAGQGGTGGSAAGGTAASGDTGAAPVAVGTISAISGQTLTLTDFGGNKITVKLAAGATVTTPGLSGPTVGAPVSVVGTKAPDGTVTATAVTVRAPAG